MVYSIRPIAPDDRKPIIDIFNDYVENSYAAYPEAKLPYEAFDMFLEMPKNFSAASIIDPHASLVGFGMLRPHNTIPTFAHTAEVTYFLSPEHTGSGLGKKLLTYLEKQGTKNGITTLLASISSRNTGSIRFHQQNGFVECGCFEKVGIKKGRVFDIVWMQKHIGPRHSRAINNEGRDA